MENIKTISLQETENFLKTIEFGEVYKLVPRVLLRLGKPNEAQCPCIYFPLDEEGRQNEEGTKINQRDDHDDHIVLLLDKEPVYACSDNFERHTDPYPYPSTDPSAVFYSYAWRRLFVKVLHKEQICFVHIGWLEKLV